MASSNPPSNNPSRVPTPSSSHNNRFTSQGATAEDLLQSQTVGLVHLTDFRKRRAQALEQKEREAHEGSLSRFTPASGNTTPAANSGASTPHQPAKKKRKSVAKGKLSFGLDGEEGDEDSKQPSSAFSTPRSSTPDPIEPSRIASPANSDTADSRKRLGPNANVTFVPKVMTKSALLREAQTREQLRKEFLAVQEAVKATDILIPFVFYDGTNIPGGACKVKKGDYIWLFLDRSRKVGAELGVGGGGGEKGNSRREWARVGVDDLMLVRGEMIIPHHYDFYYFIVNRTIGHSSAPIFDYSSTTVLPGAHTINSSSSPSPSASPEPSNYDPLARPKHLRNNGTVTPADSTLEGANEDPNLTKVVDRRWYERNKHIFPASVWEEFDPTKDYSKGSRRDTEGNAFFFS
ncbi:MAG: hypothetical protein L6R40_005101 [Gallowayella cf. fulva]|nr:MAG: hypothetical protein L6R40_005101 [Xanthomendoza cf. fulva]